MKTYLVPVKRTVHANAIVCADCPKEARQKALAGEYEDLVDEEAVDLSLRRQPSSCTGNTVEA